MDRLREIAREMRRASLIAGSRTLDYFGSAELAVEAKADSSPVSAADHAADAAIVDILETTFPAIPVVTEERADTQETLREQGVPRFFLVDPLDGTKEFISGSGDYTVNIALVEAGRPILGVVYAPAKGRLFWTPDPDFAVEETVDLDSAENGSARGAAGGGVPLEQTAPMRRLWVAEANNRALRVVASKSHRDAATDEFIAKLDVDRIESAGSSLKFCLVAGGEADVYPRMGRTMAWDTAAAHAVLRAAGGRVRRLEADGSVGAALRYGGGEDFANPAFVACAPTVELPGMEAASGLDAAAFDA